MLIDNILSKETGDLLKFRFSKYNFLLWPFIRKDVIEKIYQKSTSSLVPMASFEKTGVTSRLTYFYNTLKYNPFKFSNKPIVFVATQRTANFKKENKYFNRMTDYFALEYPDQSLVIERSERLVYRLPRYFQSVAFEDYLYFKAYLSNGLRKLDPRDEKNIYLFMELLKKKFGEYLDEKDFKKLHKKLKEHVFLYPYIYEYYQHLFKKLNISMVFSIGRGTRRIYVIKAAKDMGIKVAEIQHGTITKSHHLYNFSDEIINSQELKSYLPDYFLTFGTFWNTNIRDTTEKIVLGNPHFSCKLNEFLKKGFHEKQVNENSVLIVSQGTHTDKFVILAKELSNLLGNNYKIIFRLHPGEVPFEERYKELYAYKNIEISKTGDIYELIFDCKYIVACYSTTIFEALAFKKPIFVLKDQWPEEYIPSEIGNWFNEASEVAKMIREQTYKINENFEDFFDMNWQKNYRNFIENVNRSFK